MKHLAKFCVLLFALTVIGAPLANAAVPNTWSYFPLPSKTQKTQVLCTQGSPYFCSGTYANLPTVGYDGAISTFTGRLLDSTNVGDWQSYMRTLRAWQFKYDKVHKRFYFRMGSTLAVYDATNMVNRLNAGTGRTVADVGNRPPSANKGEAFLQWDRYFYAENPETGWSAPYIDGQDRMPDFDFDDRGNVYLAYSIFGWGIVKDDLGNSGGSILQSVKQVFGSATEVTPTLITSIKSENGTRYWALVGAAGVGTSEIWDVTNPSSPFRSGTLSRQITSAVKTDDNRRVAVFDSGAGQTIFIYSPDTLAVNGSPLFTSSNPGYKGITTDGTNFYSVRSVGGALTVTIFSPNGSGGYTETFIPTGVGMAAPQRLQYNDGYLTVVGSNDLETFRVSGNQLTRLDLKAYATVGLGSANRYFNRYYAKCGLPPCSDSIPSGYLNPDITNFVDATVFKVAGKTYLLGAFRNLADVYEIKGADGVSAANKGASGSTNPYAQSTSAGPFYGDKIVFGSTTTAQAGFNVNWSFGNPESPSDNTLSSITGADVVHQYSGLTAGQLGSPRTASVTSATDSAITDQVSVTLAAPTARIGVRNTTMLFLQPNVSSAAPIVTSDEFVDASDGTVDGHFSSWTIDTATTKAVPNASIPVGTCGSHSLNFSANYGPYIGAGSTLTSSNGALAVGLSGITYASRPFVAAINNPSSNATHVTFTSGTRATSDAAVLPSNASFTYQWDLLNSSGTSLQTATGTSTLAAIPAFAVPRTTFTGLTGVKARLQLSTAAAMPTACQQYSSSQATTAPLSAPDPKISTVSGCQYVSSPCNVTVTSASGADMSGWSFSWSATPSAGSSGTKDYSPSFSATGTYTLKVTATNAISSTDDSKAYSITTLPCVNAPAQGDIAVSYFGTSANCAPGGNCTTSDKVTFRATTFKYAWNATCDQYLWTFGDGATSTLFTPPQHQYAGNGTYQASFKLTVGSVTLTYPLTVVVGPAQQTCPGSPGCPVLCPTLSDAVVFIGYQGNTSQCSQNNTSTTHCKAGEQVSFTANANAFAGYNFLCTPHTFNWNFGDGQTGSGQTLNHVYTSAGTYPAVLSISASTGNARVELPITVTSNTTGNCQTAPSSSNMAITMSAANCSNANPNCNAGETVTFNASALAGYDVSCGTHTYAWDFGDGSGQVTGQSVQHSFSSAQAQYTVKVTVTNNAGSGILQQLVKINGGGPGCPLPTATNLFLTYNAASGCSYTNSTACAKGETVNFAVNINTFNSGGYTFTCGSHTYAWSFGDGGTSESQNPTHVFNPTNPQAFTVTCKITNPKGSVTLPLTINVGSGIQPGVQIDFATEPVPGVPTLIKFTPSVTPANSVTSWNWNWGDNSSQTLTGTSTAPLYHQYAAAATYTVTLTTDKGVVTKQVVVGGTPPPPRNRPSRH